MAHDNFFASAPPTAACEACVYGSGAHRKDCVFRAELTAALAELSKLQDGPAPQTAP